MEGATPPGFGSQGREAVSGREPGAEGKFFSLERHFLLAFFAKETY
jgi:hypothetical protein